MWKGNVWINRLYISGGTKQCKAVFQMTMSKVLQDMSLNLKRLAVTFTISPIEMSWVRVFFPLVFFLLCCTVLFFILFCLFNIIRNQMYLSCLFLPFSSCPLSPWNASQTSLHRQQNMGSATLWDLHYRYVHCNFQRKKLEGQPGSQDQWWLKHSSSKEFQNIELLFTLDFIFRVVHFSSDSSCTL